MKKIVFAVLANVFIFCSALAQDDKLNIVVECGKKTYDYGEKIELNVEFKNNSVDDTILFWSSGIPAVIKTREDNSNVLLVQTSNSLFPQVKKITVSSKGSAYKTIRISSLGIEPGKYKLKMEYVPVNIDLSNYKETPGARVFVGSLTSETIDIEIRQTSGFYP